MWVYIMTLNHIVGSALLSMLFVLHSSCAFRTSMKADKGSPLLTLDATNVVRVEVHALFSDDDPPHRSTGTKRLFILLDSDVEYFIGELHKMPAEFAFVYGCGSFIRADIVGKTAETSARIWVSWDGVTVSGVVADKHDFAVINRDFALYCFELVERYSPEYLTEVMQGSRPTPPREFILERFPFDKYIEDAAANEHLRESGSSNTMSIPDALRRE